MTRVAVQPCGNSAAQEHYVDTIKNLVASEAVTSHLNVEQLKEFTSACGKRVAVWGVTPGQRGQNRNKWAKLRPGDIALLYRNGKIFSQGRIVLCLQNRALAEALWSVMDDGETWEYVYFLDDLQEVEVPIERFNKALGYKENNIIQGFNVYEADKAEALLEMMDIPQEATEDNLPEDSLTLQKKLSDLAELSAPRQVKARIESAIFRRLLFGKAALATCDLCGKDLPSTIQVAAHIKTRSSCTDDERRDRHVVMRACKLGCDELFEKGLIIVDDKGSITASADVALSKDLTGHIASLVGRPCLAFRSENAKYFSWRRNHPRRQLRM